MKKISLGLILALLFSFQAVAQSFNAIVNRDTLPEGETFVLTLDLQGVDSSATPDLNALSKKFTTFSISNGYRTSVVNGQINKSRQWNLVLMPNQSGDIEIPALELEGYKTQPIVIKVVPAGAGDSFVQNKTAATQPKFRMTGKVDNLSPYVQQQVNYQLKLYDAGGLQGEAPFFVTDNDDWIIKSLGEPKVETKIVNGRTLREITFDYALFAQKSGELTVPAVRFNGYYLTKNTRQDPFARFFDDDEFFSGFGLHDVFANKNPVVLNTKPIKIKVLPAAASSGWWLPARDVKLSAEFENGHPQFKVGEAVSRTIYLKAVGVMDSQLPEIKFANMKGIKQYPEKPVTEMAVENGQVVSLARISNVYIPEQSGKITLPAIKLNWFNTATGNFETAIIPPYQADVMPGAAGAGLAAQPQTDGTPIVGGVPVAAGVPVAESQRLVGNTTAPIDIIDQVNNSAVIWLLVAAFAGGIALTMLLTKLFAYMSGGTNNHKRLVISAAKAKNLHSLRDELLVWGQKQFPHHKINNLQDLADIFDDMEFNKELDKIRETLYANDEKDWDPKEFLEVFCKISRRVKKHKRTITEPLPKLYK